MDNSSCNVSIATGNSVNILYEKMINLKKYFNLENVTNYQLDDFYFKNYSGSNYMSKYTLKLGEELGIKTILHKYLEKEEEAISFYNKCLQKPLDFVVLGIGLNGHLAYNEPGSSLETRTNIIKLSEDSQMSMYNYGFSKKENLPSYGITIGLKDILNSKKIYLIVLGEHKKSILKKVLNSSCFDAKIPATCLHKHENVYVYTNIKL